MSQWKEPFIDGEELNVGPTAAADDNDVALDIRRARTNDGVRWVALDREVGRGMRAEPLVFERRLPLPPPLLVSYAEEVDEVVILV
jgi:hypothetical protein